jgi:hypothetical protein
MAKQTDLEFKEVVKRSKNDSNIVGLFLVGSRGKGFAGKYADYDAVMIVKDKVAKTYKKRFDSDGLDEIDLLVMSISEFKNHAAWDSPEAWDRYDYVHVKMLVEKGKRVKKIIESIGCIPKKERHDFVARSLDGYINGVFRSVKYFRNHNMVGARLEAAQSIPYLLDALFALEGRPKPFFGYLELELKKFPLKNLIGSPKFFVSTLLKIQSTADLKAQQNLLKKAEILFRQKGFGQVFKDWEGKDKWAMNFSPQ